MDVKEIIKGSQLSPMLKINNELLGASNSFNDTDQKLFYLACASAIDRGIDEKGRIPISKQDIVKGFKYKGDAGSYYILMRNNSKHLMTNSYLTFGEDEEFADGFLFGGMTSSPRSKFIYLHVFEPFRPMLTEFVKNYQKLGLKDLMSLDSKQTMTLYQQLCLTKFKCLSGVVFTTRQLKKMFGMGIDDYMHFDKAKGKSVFDRTNFEKKVVKKAIDEINSKCSCIQNLKYIKEKTNGRVSGYRFTFEWHDPLHRDVIEGQFEQKPFVDESKITQAQYENQRKQDGVLPEWYSDTGSGEMDENVLQEALELQEQLKEKKIRTEKMIDQMGNEVEQGLLWDDEEEQQWNK